jgi:glutamate/tyrosine decarboxylase-like PLP-dependent enzyme
MTKQLQQMILHHDDFELMSDRVDLNILCFRYNPKDKNLTNEQLNRVNKTLKEKLYQDGDIYVGDTEIDGKYCFRVVIMNPATLPHYFEALSNKIKSINDDIHL